MIKLILFFTTSTILLFSKDWQIVPMLSTISVANDSVNHRNVTKDQFQEVIKYTSKKGLDSTFAIIIDYKKHSGLKRAYMLDLINMQAFDSFIVSHGCGDNQWGSDESKTNPKFSNEFESHLSSLGKYKLGKRSASQWGTGIKYFMFGLESTNNNAYKRTIVLHGWSSIPDSNLYPNGCPEGWGCPAVSNNTMYKLDSILQKTTQPVLLWAY